MKKINLGKGIVSYPMPVALVGAKVNGKANFLTVAWISMVGYNPPKIAISLGKRHFTNKGIKEHQAFSICFPSQHQIKITDLCGLISGEKEDKSKLFDVFYGESQEAPMINEFPLNVECKLDKIIDNGANETFIGDITGMYADEDVLTDGKVDFDKLDPILLTQTDSAYRSLGKKTGQAWKIGKE
ncbi:MAG: flavin reductase family protein [Bacteroidota bacterium]